MDPTPMPHTPSVPRRRHRTSLQAANAWRLLAATVGTGSLLLALPPVAAAPAAGGPTRGDLESAATRHDHLSLWEPVDSIFGGERILGVDAHALGNLAGHHAAVTGQGVLLSFVPPLTLAPVTILGLQNATGGSADDAPPGGGDEGTGDPGEASSTDRGTPSTAASARTGPPEPELTPEVDAAIARGLAWLAAQQNVDGSWGSGGRYARNVGISSLCAIAFMGAGHIPGRGEYGEVVRKTLNFVLDCSSETGLIASDRTSHGPMYGHGFATLFLGEIYGMGGDVEDPRLREALVKAVRLIVNTQNAEGGWRYNPVPDEADVSVTICQVMALRSARNAGIKVPKETIDRAVAYVQRCQNPDGGFRYMTMPGESLWPRSAAGVATLYYAGIYDDQSISRGLAYLTRNAMPGPTRVESHYHYGNYYTAQAMYLAGGSYWADFWPAIRTELLARQDRNAGYWQDPYTGGPYGTAMSLIVLQMPKRYLPIFQR